MFRGHDRMVNDQQSREVSFANGGRQIFFNLCEGDGEKRTMLLEY